jgi:hypothetical protein
LNSPDIKALKNETKAARSAPPISAMAHLISGGSSRR